MHGSSEWQFIRHIQAMSNRTRCIVGELERLRIVPISMGGDLNVFAASNVDDLNVFVWTLKSEGDPVIFEIYPTDEWMPG
uniref:Uncharacterized protein n=1 Tax=Alloyangia mangrovi TaxID=1779329 RepID=A0A2A3K2V3_9RHOB